MLKKNTILELAAWNGRVHYSKTFKEDNQQEHTLPNTTKKFSILIPLLSIDGLKLIK